MEIVIGLSIYIVIAGAIAVLIGCCIHIGMNRSDLDE